MGRLASSAGQALIFFVASRLLDDPLSQFIRIGRTLAAPIGWGLSGGLILGLIALRWLVGFRLVAHAFIVSHGVPNG